MYLSPLPAPSTSLTKSTEPAERVFHPGVTVAPRPLRRRAEGRAQVIAAYDRRVVEPPVFAAGHPVMGDAHFEEVAHHVELMPIDVAEARVAVEYMERMDVAVGRLRGEDDRDPFLEFGAQLILSLRQCGIVSGLDRQREADCLRHVVDIGIAPRCAGIFHALGLTLEHAAGGDQILQFLSLCALLQLRDAMRQPFAGDPLRLCLPESSQPDLVRAHRFQRGHCGLIRCLHGDGTIGDRDYGKKEVFHLPPNLRLVQRGGKRSDWFRTPG